MPVAKIEPSDEYPLPYDMSDEEVDDFADKLVSAANTADMLEALGAPVEVDPQDFAAEKKFIDAAIKDHKASPLNRLPTAVGASAFLKQYGAMRAFDANEIRAALTNKLLEIADCGEIRYELKAIEMLGKHSDIGLFTERSEININYNSPEALETAIKERVKRLLNADIIDITPMGMNLDEELGILDADFAEIVAEAEATVPKEEGK